jgi:hypothetical protein
MNQRDQSALVIQLQPIWVNHSNFSSQIPDKFASRSSAMPIAVIDSEATYKHLISLVLAIPNSDCIDQNDHFPIVWNHRVSRLIVLARLMIVDRSHNFSCDSGDHVFIIRFPCVANCRSSCASEQITLRMRKDDWSECRRANNDKSATSHHSVTDPRYGLRHGFLRPVRTGSNSPENKVYTQQAISG